MAGSSAFLAYSLLAKKLLALLAAYSALFFQLKENSISLLMPGAKEKSWKCMTNDLLMRSFSHNTTAKSQLKELRTASTQNEYTPIHIRVLILILMLILTLILAVIYLQS